MTRKIELAVLAATLAIVAPFTAASAATRHHASQPAQPVMIEPAAATPTPATGFFAANGAAAFQHVETLVQAADQGGGDGGSNN